MDLHNEEPFKAKTYANAAFNLKQIKQEIRLENLESLKQYNGIGSSILNNIKELLETGTLSVLQNYLDRTPQSVLEMLSIKGIGPKKINVLWKEMEISSIQELEQACIENKLITIKGFGVKTQEAILKQIHFLKNNEGLFLWVSANQELQKWLQQLRKSFPQHRFEACGDVYQQNEVLDKIEIISTLDYEVLPNLWSKAQGIQFDEKEEHSFLLRLPETIPIKFHFTTKDKFGVDWVQKSASTAFWEHIVTHYKLPEIAIDEKDFFHQIGLHFIPAALRYNTSFISNVEITQQLIEKNDIKGIIHAHSTWSDGQESIETMVQYAIKNNFQYLLITDHSQSAFYANGLKEERIILQHKEIDLLNQKYAPFKVFKGIEADILNNGQLDYPAHILSQFDLIISSVHSNLNMNLEQAMERLLTAIKNPYTSILGHATGRLLLSRAGYPIDHKVIIDACAAHNVVIEINANPRRLDIDWRWINDAVDRGVMLSINPDAHSLEGIEDIYYGVMVAQKGALSASMNLSSFSLEQIEKFIQKQHEKRNLQP